MDRGAHFHKCDFQVHTPRDRQWDGPDCVTVEDRQSFARNLIEAARSKGLQALAITDHHDLALFRYVRDAATNESGVPTDQRIVVFPGVELTLGIPCQAILLFDSNLPDDLLPAALTTLGIAPAPETESDTAEVEKLTHFMSFEALYKRLNESVQFQGRFIAFPHVKDGGHQTLLRQGFEAHYKAMPCVGGYTDGVAKLGVGNQRILSGQDANYGNKKVAVIQTSDSRSISFAALGSAPAWIKWSTPTAEALRQACLSDKSRIALTEPVFPKARILSIQVSDSAFLGPLDLYLNPQYNALIGGRGTGKSSALEYIRWGLCDQPVTVDEEQIGDIPNYAAKRELLISGTLKARNAIVTVNCELNGVPHSIRRDAHSAKVEMRVGIAEWAQTTEQEVRDKFPIQAYSQKQLSSVGVLPVEIERLVTAEIAPKVDAIATSLRLLSDSIRQLWAQSQRKTTLNAEISREQSQLVSEKAQVEALRAQLKGLSPDDQAVLGQATTYTKQQSALTDLLSLFAAVRTKLGAQKADIDRLLGQLPPLDGLPNKDALEAISATIKAEIENITRHLESAMARLVDGSPTHRAIQDSAEQVQRIQDEFAKKYAEAKAKSTSQQSSLTELARLEQSVEVLNKSIQDKSALLTALGDPVTELAAKWKEWAELHRKRSELIKVQCERLYTLSAGEFRAHAKPCGNPAPIQEALAKCFAGRSIRKVDEKIETLAQEVVASDDPLKAWYELAAELERLSQSRETGTLPDTPILEKALLSRPNRESLQGLGADAILEVRLTPLEDRPQFEFRAGPDSYITFAQASSGQQATSLLKVLLNQEGPPLLIDQPEEDLDNEVIQEIATIIWSTKSKRQLVFVSHNANIVVNGDAELVVCFDYVGPNETTRGHVKCEGAIDIGAVKEAITRVMEGGDKAFDLRRQKYGF